MITRRAFLAALACLPVIGKLIPKPEPLLFHKDAFALVMAPLATVRPVFDLAPPHEHEYGEWLPAVQTQDGSHVRYRRCKHCRTWTFNREVDREWGIALS